MEDKDKYLQYVIEKNASLEKDAGFGPANNWAMRTLIKRLGKTPAPQKTMTQHVNQKRWELNPVQDKGGKLSSNRLQGIFSDNGAKELNRQSSVIAGRASQLRDMAAKQREDFQTRQQYLGAAMPGKQMFATARVKLPNGQYMKTASVLPSFTGLLEKIAIRVGTVFSAGMKRQNQLNKVRADLKAARNSKNYDPITKKFSDKNEQAAYDKLMQQDKILTQKMGLYERRINGGKGSSSQNNGNSTGSTSKQQYGGDTPGMFNSLRNTIANHPLTSMVGAAFAGKALFGGNDDDDRYERKYASVNFNNNGDLNKMNFYQYNLEKCAAAQQVYNEAAYDMQAAEAMYVDALQKMASAEEVYKIAASKANSSAKGAAMAAGGAGVLGGLGAAGYNMLNNAKGAIADKASAIGRYASSLADAKLNGDMNADIDGATGGGHFYVDNGSTIGLDRVNIPSPPAILPAGTEGTFDINGYVPDSSADLALSHNAENFGRAVSPATWNGMATYAPVAGATIGAGLGAGAGYYAGKKFNSPRMGAAIGGVVGGVAGGLGGGYIGSRM